jgi:hypothetical protein
VGHRVNRVELKAVDPPMSIKDSMEKQMRADRDKRAAILTAEGVKQSQILTAEGEKQSAILRAEGQRQSMILEAEGQAQAIAPVFKAIHEGKPDPKLLAYQYLQMLPQIAQGESNKMWIIPSELDRRRSEQPRLGSRAGDNETTTRNGGARKPVGAPSASFRRCTRASPGITSAPGACGRFVTGWRFCFRFLGTRRARSPSTSSRVIAVGVGILTSGTSSRTAGRIDHANVLGVDAAGGLFLAAFGFKAWGGSGCSGTTSARHARARRAGGAATVTGLALPAAPTRSCGSPSCAGFPGRRVGIGSICLSLFLLGLIDNAA